MKRISALILLGSLAAAGGAAATGSQSLNESQSGVMPVLVQVNANGKVTRVSPATALAPRYQRLLRHNIEALVSGPAMNRHKAVSRQVVMNVALKTTPRPDGSYDAHFAYVSMSALPSMPMHWRAAAIDGHGLALARHDDSFEAKHHVNWKAPRQHPFQYR